MKLLSKPYNFLGLLGGIFLLLTLVLNQDATTDIHMHDLVLIIANAHFVGISAAFLLYLWLIYSFTHKIVFSRILYWSHIVCTILFFVLFMVTSYIEIPKLAYSTRNFILTVSFIIFFIAQIFFVLNLLAGIIKKIIFHRLK